MLSVRVGDNRETIWRFSDCGVHLVPTSLSADWPVVCRSTYDCRSVGLSALARRDPPAPFRSPTGQTRIQVASPTPFGLLSRRQRADRPLRAAKIVHLYAR